MEVGKKYKVKLSNGTEFVSDVFAFESTSSSNSRDGIWVFRAEAAHTFTKAAYRAVPSGAIVATELVGEGSVQQPWRVPTASEQKSAEENALLAARRRDKAKASGVPAHLQTFFEKLHKALNDVEWNSAHQMIIIHKRLALRAPYDGSKGSICPVAGAPEDVSFAERLQHKVIPRILAEIKAATSSTASSSAAGGGGGDDGSLSPLSPQTSTGSSATATAAAVAVAPAAAGGGGRGTGSSSNGSGKAAGGGHGGHGK